MIENMDNNKGQMQVIDIDRYVAETKENWINYTLTEVNDSVIRLGIFQGEFHWHHHDNEDEFFYVVSGKLYLDIVGETIELLPRQGYTVPRGVEHRTRAKEKSIVLMVGGNTVNPKGD